MIIEPKVRGFICTTAHPDGCEESVRQQINFVKQQGKMEGSKKVLVIGASTGYGLASRITAAFACGADTLGIMFEKEASDRRTATPGWYNTKAFEKFAAQEGLFAKTINGDAFSEEIKNQAIQTIRAELGTVDLVIYSLAAPRRTAKNGTTFQSVLKTTGQPFTNKTLDLRTNEVSEVTIFAATAEEEEATVKVMGGEDWKEWITCLEEAGVLAEQAVTIAYSYIGPELTYPIYYEGTIGKAKEHLFQTAVELNQEFKKIGLKAYISVNKALVTQASAAIPIVPLYIGILYRIMKQKGIHEGCIEQIYRLFREQLVHKNPTTDAKGRIRLDDYEMREDVQQQVKEIWEQIQTENVKDFADIDGYWMDFYNMFGFRYDNIDYTRDIEQI